MNRFLSRRQVIQLITIASLGRVPLLRAAQGGGDWQPIFDGKTLTGWKPTEKSHHSKASGNTTGGNWRVDKGAIVGDQDTPGNGGFLMTEAEYGDCEIVLETNNDFGTDSGVFLRCTQDGKGYQCLIDYHDAGTIGGILGERIWSGRAVRNYSFGKSPDIITLNENAAHPCPVLPEAWKNFWHVGEWNEVRARITGDPPTIATWVNGVKIMEHTEPRSVHPAKGHVGLQIHGGKKFAGTVRYRNIRVRVL